MFSVEILGVLLTELTPYGIYFLSSYFLGLFLWPGSPTATADFVKDLSAEHRQPGFGVQRRGQITEWQLVRGSLPHLPLWHGPNFVVTAQANL